MSTEDQNKAVVTLKKEVNVDAFIEDMVSGTNHNEFMPGRRVELFNEKPDSLRNVDFVLTKDEANRLKLDPRIIDVRYGTKIENGIILSKNATDTSKLYSKTNTLLNTHYNWAIPACISVDNPFDQITDLTFTHAFPTAGSNVDVVIQDSGIDPNHPEWLNFAGTASRLQLLDWPTVAGLSETYTQSLNHYSDPDGHGTHVAGSVAGRLYGWAKEAKIHAISIIDNPAAFGVSASFNLIRAWHNLKPITSTGYKRPTVVNMSWGYFKIYENITGGNYRGTPWTSTSLQSVYGMVSTVYNRLTSPTRYYHPVRVASVDADIEDCIDDGIILVGAAGNDAHKIDAESGLDYNNFYTNSVDGNIYYHRGSTPGSTAGVINVGSVKLTEPEGKSFFSNTGPRVNVFAPGESIMSAIPVDSTIATESGSTTYPTNPSFSVTKIGGTSMASPQVAGVIACVLDARPQYNQASALNWVLEISSNNRLSDTAGSYTDLASLQGHANKFLRQPFSSDVAWKFSGS